MITDADTVQNDPAPAEAPAADDHDVTAIADAEPDIVGGGASAVLTINADNCRPIRDEVLPAEKPPNPSKSAVTNPGPVRSSWT